MEDVVVMEMRRGTDNKVVSRQFIDYFKSCLFVSVNKRKPLSAFLSDGYPEQQFAELWKICDGNNLKKDAKMLVVNDFALEGVYELLKRDFTNITILVTHDKIMHSVQSCINRYYKLPIPINVIQISEVHKMHEKFDLMIANPPFSVGSDVINTCLPHCEVASVLMPISKYKGNKLYQHVETLKMIKEDGFDAQIGGCSCVCKLTNDIYETDLSKFELARITDGFEEFFNLNFQHAPIYKQHFEAGYAERNSIKYDVDTAFVVSLRASTNGVHRSGNDVEYNLHFHPVKVNVTSNIYVLESKKHKQNLNRLWYGNPIMTQILHAYNCPSGVCELCIPRIDYSVDRDYEHLTLDDLINILKEENK